MKTATILAALCLAATNLVAPLPAGAFSLGAVTRENDDAMAALFIHEKDRSNEPFAHVLFCNRLPSECEQSDGPDTVEWSAETRRNLKALNRRINRDISPRNDHDDDLDLWSLNPQAGDCEDYAISKRHALVRAGWPVAALRLAVAYTEGGEGHLVLVVRTSKGDMVLDNRTDAVRNWRLSGLRWQLIQAAGNPRIWHRV
jgi:predicted transglutaminase-like cysteine proteinase